MASFTDKFSMLTNLKMSAEKDIRYAIRKEGEATYLICGAKDCELNNNDPSRVTIGTLVRKHEGVVTSGGAYIIKCEGGVNLCPTITTISESFGSCNMHKPKKDTT